MKQLIISICLIFGIVTILMYLWQRHLIYFPSRENPLPENYQASDMQVVSLRTYNDPQFLDQQTQKN